MLIWYTTSIASLTGVGITSETCLLTATLADKDNPLSDTLLSDNSSNSQETFVEGRWVCSWMAHRCIYSACACSVSKSYNQNINIKCNACDVMLFYHVVRCWYRLVNTLGSYVNTLEYTELLKGLILIGYMEVRCSLLYYVLLV